MATVVETTSYSHIFKKKKFFCPWITVDTTATSGIFRMTSENKKGTYHRGRNYKLQPNFQKEGKIESTVHG